MCERARWAVAGLVGVVTVLLAGCTGDPAPNTSTVSPVASVPASSASSSVSASPSPSVRPYPADVPLTGHNVKPGEKPPLYPAAARARTQDGVNAFAEFYMRTLDWAYATTNPSYMRHYTGPSCGLCTGLATGISKTAAEKHWYLGGRLTVHPATAAPIGPVTAPADFCSVVAVDITAQSVVDRTGAVVNGEAAHPNFRWKLCAEGTANEWRTTYFSGIE